MYILQTRLCSLEINSKILHDFRNTTFYIKHIKETSHLTFFILHPIVTANRMLVLFYNPANLAFLHVLI